MLLLRSTTEVMHISANNMRGSGDQTSRQADISATHVHRFLCQTGPLCHQQVAKALPSAVRAQTHFLRSRGAVPDEAGRCFNALLINFAWYYKSQRNISIPQRRLCGYNVSDVRSYVGKSIFDSKTSSFFVGAAAVLLRKQPDCTWNSQTDDKPRQEGLFLD